MTFSIGDDLREYPDAPNEFLKGISHLKKRVENEHGDERLKTMSRLSAYHRIAGNLEEALHLAEEVDVSATGQLKLTNRIRMTVIYQFLGEYNRALEIMADCEKTILANPAFRPTLDFINQHRGKMFFEMNELEKALHEFNEALKLREAKNDRLLIQSSAFAIEKTRERLNQAKASNEMDERPS